MNFKNEISRTNPNKKNHITTDQCKNCCLQIIDLKKYSGSNLNLEYPHLLDLIHTLCSISFNEGYCTCDIKTFYMKFLNFIDIKTLANVLIKIFEKKYPNNLEKIPENRFINQKSIKLFFNEEFDSIDKLIIVKKYISIYIMSIKLRRNLKRFFKMLIMEFLDYITIYPNNVESFFWCNVCIYIHKRFIDRNFTSKMLSMEFLYIYKENIKSNVLEKNNYDFFEYLKQQQQLKNNKNNFHRTKIITEKIQESENNDKKIQQCKRTKERIIEPEFRKPEITKKKIQSSKFIGKDFQQQKSIRDEFVDLKPQKSEINKNKIQQTKFINQNPQKLKFTKKIQEAEFVEKDFGQYEYIKEDFIKSKPQKSKIIREKIQQAEFIEKDLKQDEIFENDFKQHECVKEKIINPNLQKFEIDKKENKQFEFIDEYLQECEYIKKYLQICESIKKLQESEIVKKKIQETKFVEEKQISENENKKNPIDKYGSLKNDDDDTDTETETETSVIIINSGIKSVWENKFYKEFIYNLKKDGFKVKLLEDISNDLESNLNLDQFLECKFDYEDYDQNDAEKI